MTERLDSPLGDLTRSGEVALEVLRGLPATSVFVFDPELRVVMLTGLAGRRHGFRPDEVEGRLIADVFPAEVFARLEPHYRSALAGTSDLFSFEMSDGRFYEIETTPLRDRTGSIVGGISISRDVTEGREARRARFEAEALFASAFENAPIGMAVVAPDGSVQRVNRALCELTGFTFEQLLASSFGDITHPDDRPRDLDLFRRALDGEFDSYASDKRCLTADGGFTWSRLSVSLVRDERGRPHHFVAQVEDISERRRGEDELKHRAEHDSLTNLKNRGSFERSLQDLLAERDGASEPAALLLIDLDDFKALNDSQGHLAGDRFLRHVADTLASSVRDGDLVARIGGDEFAVLLPGADEESARRIARDLNETIRRRPLLLDGRRTDGTASIGVIPLDDPELGPEGAMHLVDQALYEAKSQGRNRVTWHHDADA